jgi:signal transduction histidine kinase
MVDGEEMLIFAGHSLAGRDRDLRTLMQTMLIGGGIGVGLAIMGGYWLSGRALAPIQRSLESQRRFVSDASHELRTPLAVLRANNELLERHPEQSIGANLEQVDAIAQETEHMGRLVDDLLTLARADEGRLLGRLDLVDVGEIAAAVVHDMQPIAAQKEIALTGEVRAALVEGDQPRLRQLVLILVDNAIKYTPAGGAVAVAAARAGRTVTLTVADTGPGVGVDARRTIFERFARLEAERGRAATGGTGLGLAIAREIVSAHGGQIGVGDRAGGGAVFTVRLRASS